MVTELIMEETEMCIAFVCISTESIVKQEFVEENVLIIEDELEQNYVFVIRMPFLYPLTNGLVYKSK